MRAGGLGLAVGWPTGRAAVRALGVMPVLDTIRRPMVWLVVLAIVIYGQSAALVRLLGPAHRHDTVSVAAPPSLLARIDKALHDLRTGHGEPQTRPAPQTAAAHGHQHSAGSRTHPHAGYERHLHDPHDASVVPLDGLNADGAADPASPASAGSAALPLALAPHWVFASPAHQAQAWPVDAADRWTDASLRLPERPPSVRSAA